MGSEREPTDSDSEGVDPTPGQKDRSVESGAKPSKPDNLPDAETTPKPPTSGESGGDSD